MAEAPGWVPSFAWIIPVLAAVSQWFSTKLMSGNQPSTSADAENPMAQSMKTMTTTMPLHLPYMIPCSYRASACKAVLPSCMAFYVISVRQTGDLPVVSLFPHPASFRFHLAMDTLTFGYILPTTGRIRDLHPLETCAAGRTFPKKPASDESDYRLSSYCLS